MLLGRKVVFYELNEVPLRIIDWFAAANPKSTLAKLVQHGRIYRTFTEDSGHLSPWITWPTLHRGVTNQQHEIYDFGQALDDVNCEYPPLWMLLADAGRRVGVFGSLHSYPLPVDLANYAFYVPDTFAAGPECFPKDFEWFQAFNLTMMDRSARNVSRSIALGPALKFLRAAAGLGLRGRTIVELGRQIAVEQVKRQRVVRRRTSQVQIAFDFFLKATAQERPEAAFFFTESRCIVDTSLLAGLLPDDYRNGEWPTAWRQSFVGEIPFAMTHADRQLRDLYRLVLADDDYVLIVTSSMGQAAVEGQEMVRTQLNIGSVDRFMRALGVAPEEWERRRAMIPLYTFALAEPAIDGFRDAVTNLAVNGATIGVREHSCGVFSIQFGHSNLDEAEIAVSLKGAPISLADLGLINQRIQDEAGSNAYHIPEGSMIVFDPRRPAAGAQERPTVSTIEIAPALLANFGVPIPSYMRRHGAL